MANKEIKDIYDEIKMLVADDTDLTNEYMDKINKHFYSYIKNPTEEKEETFKRLRDALILMWLASLIKKIAKQAIKQVAVGISFGKQMIKSADIKKVINKAITKDKIRQMVQAHVDKAMTELTFVSNGIKINSDKAISDIKSNFDKTKKVISAELMSEFSDYGITYYEDRSGRRQNIGYYTNRKVTDLLLNAFRDSYIAEMVRNGVEYAVVKRLPTTAVECENCMPFDDCILAFNDNDEGVMTVAEARAYNLFHFTCFHYLEPTQDLNNIKEIVLSEENKKSKEKNDRNNKTFNLFS